MKSFGHLLITIALTSALQGLCTVQAPAQGAAQKSPPDAPKSAPAAPSIPLPIVAPKPAPDYVLGADDVIEVDVNGHAELSRTLVIPPDGKVALPEVGEIAAAGQTAKALAAQIQAKLEETRNNVTVVVSIKDVRSQSVHLVGATRTNGVIGIKPGWRLMDVIAVAGGLNVKPDRVSGHLYRTGRPVIALDLVKADSSPDSDANVVLQSGDLIVIDELPPVHKQVHVIGQVLRPGAYEFEAETNIFSLISEAGGPTPNAQLRKAYVLRGVTETPMDLEPVLLEGKTDDAVYNFKLEPGDVLFIPVNDHDVGVMGAVGRSGYYAIPEKDGMTVLKALSAAGGPTPDGDLSKAVIIRDVGGKATILPVNIGKILKNAKLADNVTMQEKDILYIPSKKRPLQWQDALTPFSVLSFLGLRLFR